MEGGGGGGRQTGDESMGMPKRGSEGFTFGLLEFGCHLPYKIQSCSAAQF
jgi:hypothetical protein